MQTIQNRFKLKQKISKNTDIRKLSSINQTNNFSNIYKSLICIEANTWFNAK